MYLLAPIFLFVFVLATLTLRRIIFFIQLDKSKDTKNKEFQNLSLVYQIVCHPYMLNIIHSPVNKVYAYNKIRYIFENMECETNIEKKKNIENLLKECNTINSYN